MQSLKLMSGKSCSKDRIAKYKTILLLLDNVIIYRNYGKSEVLVINIMKGCDGNGANDMPQS